MSSSRRADFPDPGPVDATVLHLQRSHRSHDIWEDRDIADSSWRVYHAEGSWRRRHIGLDDPRVLVYLHRAGFYGFSQMGYMSYDWHLIRAMTERWREETHTFHLPVGEATITLQDVEVFLGLPVDGLAVTDGVEMDDASLSAACERLLGFDPPFWKGRRFRTIDIVHYLEQHPLAADDDELVIQQHARCVCMLLISVLFADKSSNLVSAMFLPLLDDLEIAGTYSWGGAALAWLYRCLCIASRAGEQSVTGPVILIQLWAWSRISSITPTRGPLPYLHDPLQLPVGPGGRFWSSVGLGQTEVPSHSIVFYRDQLDQMLPQQMVWQPYGDDFLAGLPPYCRAGAAVYRYRGPLIYFFAVEMHAPDRVMRQFGLRQYIPTPIDTSRVLHGLDQRGRSGTVWSALHDEHIQSWSGRAAATVSGESFAGIMQMTDIYMTWYWSITRRYIGRVALPAPTQGSQPVAGLHATSVDRFSSIGQSLAALLETQGHSMDPIMAQQLRDMYQSCQSGLDTYGASHRLDRPLPEETTFVHTPVAHYGQPSGYGGPLAFTQPSLGGHHYQGQSSAAGAGGLGS